ncbi:Prenyl transferase [Triticum urartu]|uniref:Prenyl transferase n=1 Tax=Triticum urartu TaxID=4572 RepID=M7ZR93_TRIUA|nr:Prenyl transferase [Triticum urartu]
MVQNCKITSFEGPKSKRRCSKSKSELGGLAAIDVPAAETIASAAAGTARLPERVSIASLLDVVSDDLLKLNNNLKSLIGAENPVLVSAAEQIFGAGGKRLRPALVFLVSRATAEVAGLSELTTEHKRLAEIIEMIHTASLIHDDVIDDSGMRRGKETIHQLYGTRIAVLAGDFMFAQSSWFLANLENIEVIKLISQVIKDFASGEIKQQSTLFDCDVTLDDYLLKSYYKTASLLASSTRSAAIFSGELAKEKGDLALQNLQCLPRSHFRTALENMVKYNLERID